MRKDWQDRSRDSSLVPGPALVSKAGMKKVFFWFAGLCVVIGTVLVVLSAVRAPFDPLRKTWWRYKAWKNPIYEARVVLTLVRPITNEELEVENHLLDSEAFLMPLVRELGLAADWGVPNDGAAMVRLAEHSGLRRGTGDLELVLTVQDANQGRAAKIMNPLGKRYFENKQLVPGAAGGGER
jgi:hypothetical protein